ncbi:MAG: hypothetical protein IIX84_02720, partial [Oscillospiraceae bacterium]|nr:hypothetical protein [Oscillospiraceae bacterium]
KETDSHVGLSDLLGMTGISGMFVGRVACPRRFWVLYVTKKTDSHVGLSDLLGMTGISGKFVGRAACPRRFLQETPIKYRSDVSGFEPVRMADEVVRIHEQKGSRRHNGRNLFYQ